MTDNRTTELKSLSKLKMAGKLRYWRGTIEIPESELHAICDEIQAEHDRAVAATLGEQRSTVEIAELLDEFEHECYMLRVEASETRAKDNVVRESYERIRDEFAGRIAAAVGCADVDDAFALLDEIREAGRISYDDYSQLFDAIAELVSGNEYEAKMDALLCRLTNGKWSKSHAYSLDFMVSCIDENYEELYEKERAELGNGTLTAEQVREAIERHSAWVIGNNRCFHDGAYEEIADELNAELGSGTCEMKTDWDYLHDGIPDAPEDTWAYMCSACGWSFRYDRGVKPKYCPDCGCRVVKR